MTEPCFFKKKKKKARTAVQKVTENGLKNGFFDYIEKFDH